MMSGYGDRETPSTGVHDSLYASAFYFEGEKERTILITADLIGSSFDFTEEMRGKGRRVWAGIDQGVWNRQNGNLK